MEVEEDEIILFWRFTRSLCSTEHHEYLCTVLGGEVLEPQSLMKPSLAPPVHVKKARKTGSHGDCDYAFLCYRDHSDPAPSFMARTANIIRMLTPGIRKENAAVAGSAF